MSFDFTAPLRNSIGLGTYASFTMRVKISGVVLSTQSATPPSGLPFCAEQPSLATFSVHLASSCVPSVK